MTRPILRILGIVAAAGLAAGAALAQDHDDHGDHNGHGAAPTDAPSTAGYVAANDRMHADMAIEFTGDADVDFARGMIPHHQGAIDMARVVLEFGSDPELRQLAEAIIAAQEAEIAFLRDWLAAHGQ